MIMIYDEAKKNCFQWPDQPLYQAEKMFLFVYGYIGKKI